ncbi:MAG: CPBP family intramembrane metalloprotease [Candidatus Thorarchaeota archaeon]|nr:CPBP family intramembrane metalloprotease [Candidatus Thorarchaeota archaeon]
MLILVLVFLLITRIEKKEFQLAALGLNLQANTLPFVVIGLILGSVLFFGAAMFGVLIDTLHFPILPDFSQWQILISFAASLIFYVMNSFWQELLFRGYLQTRTVDEYGRAIGISGVAVVFVVFHGLVQSLTPISILTGVLLFLFIGLLYDKTKSLYLVGALHAVLNFLPVLFNTWWQGLEAATIYCIAFALLVLLILSFERRGHEDVI